MAASAVTIRTHPGLGSRPSGGAFLPGVEARVPLSLGADGAARLRPGGANAWSRFVNDGGGSNAYSGKLGLDSRTSMRYERACVRYDSLTWTLIQKKTCRMRVDAGHPQSPADVNSAGHLAVSKLLTKNVAEQPECSRAGSKGYPQLGYPRNRTPGPGGDRARSVTVSSCGASRRGTPSRPGALQPPRRSARSPAT